MFISYFTVPKLFKFIIKFIIIFLLLIILQFLSILTVVIRQILYYWVTRNFCILLSFNFFHVLL